MFLSNEDFVLGLLIYPVIRAASGKLGEFAKAVEVNTNKYTNKSTNKYTNPNIKKSVQIVKKNFISGLFPRF